MVSLQKRNYRHLWTQLLVSEPRSKTIITSFSIFTMQIALMFAMQWMDHIKSSQSQIALMFSMQGMDHIKSRQETVDGCSI